MYILELNSRLVCFPPLFHNGL